MTNKLEILLIETHEKINREQKKPEYFWHYTSLMSPGGKDEHLTYHNIYLNGQWLFFAVFFFLSHIVRVALAREKWKIHPFKYSPPKQTERNISRWKQKDQNNSFICNNFAFSRKKTNDEIEMMKEFHQTWHYKTEIKHKNSSL